jgi:N-acetylglucosaminyldiphosphoundecaprenol N-acetyl-beta-D-mannosaminyltransferase
MPSGEGVTVAHDTCREQRVAAPFDSTCRVGPFRVADAGLQAIVEHCVRGLGTRTTALALHVGALNARSDRAFVAAVDAADVVYADGAAVVLLARAAGHRGVSRTATTDLGWELFAQASRALGRPARVVVIGGPSGLAEAAAIRLEATGHVDVRYSTHGYHRAWDDVLAHARAAAPDVVVVGLGMPREALWVHQHAAALPECLVFTCGGWLGFVAGHERRAPVWAQQHGFEWLFRLAHQPRRLARRYASGFLTILRMLPGQITTRRP